MTERPEVGAGVTGADLQGRTALVTGSTSGIGRETALALGRLGADVLVHGRDREAGRTVVSRLESLGVRARFQRADFADPAAVRNLAAAVRNWTDDLDLLVNNAGGLFREADRTTLGVERTFHVNHLGPYLLTAELLDDLAPDARVVTTASDAHRGVGLELETVTESGGGFRAYQRSKLANVLFTAELAARLEAAGREVTANSFHPGAVPGSGFSRFLPGPLPQLVAAADGLPFVTSVAEGAETAVFLAASDRVTGVTGRYCADGDPRTPRAAARDRDLARSLWTRSAALLDIDVPLADADPGRG
jgi:NAD(P)-dependent dehydrogenase (short-subunit alcohol dehydrogenase family)